MPGPVLGTPQTRSHLLLRTFLEDVHHYHRTPGTRIHDMIGWTQVMWLLRAAHACALVGPPSVL